MISSEPPTSWASAALDDLIVFALGGDWGKAPDHQDSEYVDVRCIRASEIRNWSTEKGKSAALRRVKKSSLETRKLREGDIIVEISGGGPEQPVGRTVLIDNAALNRNPTTPKICTNFFRLARPSHEIDSAYLNHYLQHFYETGRIARYQGGSNNLRNLKFNDYLTIRVPLPPAREQRRIVAKIEELFSELDNGIETLKIAREQLKIYRQTLLKHAFEGKLTAKWREQNKDRLESVNQILDRLADGRSTRYDRQVQDWKFAVREWEKTGELGPRPRMPHLPRQITLPLEDEIGGFPKLPLGWLWIKVQEVLLEPPANGRSVKDRADGFPVLRLTALRGGKIDLSQRKAGDWDRSDALQYLVREGDFLLARGNGSKNLVGRGGLVETGEDEVAYPDTMIRLRPDSAVMDGQFFSYVWDSLLLRRQIEAAARTTAGIYKINQEHIVNFVIPLCSPAEQDEINRLIDHALSISDQLELELTLELSKADALRQSILKKAFSGRLVAQDPNDEAASILLERIKTQRVSITAAAAPRRDNGRQPVIKKRITVA